MNDLRELLDFLILLVEQTRAFSHLLFELVFEGTHQGIQHLVASLLDFKLTLKGMVLLLKFGIRIVFRVQLVGVEVDFRLKLGHLLLLSSDELLTLHRLHFLLFNLGLQSFDLSLMGYM